MNIFNQNQENQNYQNSIEKDTRSPELREEQEKREKDFQKNLESKLSFLPKDKIGNIRGKFILSGNLENSFSSLKENIQDPKLVIELQNYIESGTEIPKDFQKNLIDSLEKGEKNKSEILQIGNTITQLTQLASKIDNGEIKVNQNYSLDDIEDTIFRAEHIRQYGNSQERENLNTEINNILDSYKLNNNEQNNIVENNNSQSLNNQTDNTGNQNENLNSENKENNIIENNNSTNLNNQTDNTGNQNENLNSENKENNIIEDNNSQSLNNEIDNTGNQNENLNAENKENNIIEDNNSQSLNNEIDNIGNQNENLNSENNQNNIIENNNSTNLNNQTDNIGNQNENLNSENNQNNIIENNNSTNLNNQTDNIWNQNENLNAENKENNIIENNNSENNNKNKLDRPESNILKHYLDLGKIDEKTLNQTLENLNSLEDNDGKEYENAISSLPNDIKEELKTNFGKFDNNIDEIKDQRKNDYFNLLESHGVKKPDENNIIENAIGENFIMLKNNNGENLEKKSIITAIQTATNNEIHGKHFTEKNSETYKKAKKIIENGENIGEMKQAFLTIHEMINQNEGKDSELRKKNLDNNKKIENHEIDIISKLLESYKKEIEQNIKIIENNPKGIEFQKNIEKIYHDLSNGTESITRGQIQDTISIGQEIFPDFNPINKKS